MNKKNSAKNAAAQAAQAKENNLNEPLIGKQDLQESMNTSAFGLSNSEAS